MHPYLYILYITVSAL